MNDADLGRGAFIYICVFGAIELFGLYFGIHLSKAWFGFDMTVITGGFGFFECNTMNLIILLNVFVIWHSVLTKGWGRSLGAFGLTFLCAFTAEALGVHFGMVFGHYHYPEALGFQIIGVPLLVALAWEPILYSAYYVADFLLGFRFDMAKPPATRLMPYLVLALLGALATTTWDLMMDPFAVGRGWWVWHEGGPYLPEIAEGVPISNFIGWLKVAFVCQLIYRFFMLETGRVPRKSVYLTVYGPLALYLVLFLNALGLVLVVAQKPVVGLIGGLAMGSIAVAALGKVYALQRDGRLMENVSRENRE